MISGVPIRESLSRWESETMDHIEMYQRQVNEQKLKECANKHHNIGLQGFTAVCETCNLIFDVRGW